MLKQIVRVSGASNCFRVVIPRKFIKKLSWDNVEYIVIEEFTPHGVKIRRVFDGEDSKE